MYQTRAYYLMNCYLSPIRLCALLLAFLLAAPEMIGATRKKLSKAASSAALQKKSKVRKVSVTKVSVSRKHASRKSMVKRPRGRALRLAGATSGGKRGRRIRHFAMSVAGGSVAGGPWSAPTFANSTEGDNVDGEDLLVRKAAVDALGPYNGSVVVADPQTGRILSIVNQKLAFQSGFQPCSTIKIVAALAGLSEKMIDRDTNVRLYGRSGMNLVNALAHSNNPYFANIGVKLGYDKIAYYAKQFGLGEKAGLNIEEEQAGTIPSAPPANGGMGMMTSFGEGIKLTPLQLTALLSAIANGGTLHYLQYPKNQAEIQNFVPKIKRQLGIGDVVPDLKVGMQGAVAFGTARRAGFDQSELIFGKTGTCTDRATPTHLGWFGSFMEVGNRKLAVVVLLTGGRPVNGPVASGVAGSVYRNLNAQHYLSGSALTPATLLPSLRW